MSTLYYCACLDCQSLVNLDRFYLVPSLDEFFDLDEDVALYKDCTTYNQHCIYLLVFLLKHPGHRIILGNSDALDTVSADWYDSYTRELEVP